MIEIIGTLGSINILASIVLVIVVIVIVYQVKSLKSNQPVQKNVSVPDYDKNIKYSKIEISKDIIPQVKRDKVVTKRKQRIIMFMSLIALVSLTVLLVNIFIFGNESNRKTQSSEKINIVKSSGIYLYNSDWKPISQEQASKLIKDKEKIIIGIETIENGGIDKARIKINESSWSSKNETMLFKKDKNMYYTEFSSASLGASLVIEAQLHSKEEGWLGK